MKVGNAKRIQKWNHSCRFKSKRNTRCNIWIWWSLGSCWVLLLLFVIVWSCCCSVTKLCPTLCHPMDHSVPGFLSFAVFQSFLKLMSEFESVMLSNYLFLCHPFSSFLQSFPSPGSFSVSLFFTSGGQSIGTSVQHQFFQGIFRIDFL